MHHALLTIGTCPVATRIYCYDSLSCATCEFKSQELKPELARDLRFSESVLVRRELDKVTFFISYKKL